MANSPKSIGIIGRLTDPRVADPALTLVQFLQQRGVGVMLGASSDGPAELTDLPRVDNENETVKLSSFKGQKPVALIFGSYT